MADPIVVTVSRRIAASPEAVFDAWLDPGAAGRWLFATPDGVMERVEIDARVGGRFLIAERRGRDLAEHVGEYLVLDRPGRIVFTFSAAPGAGFTRVAVTIEPDGDGALVTLVHAMDAPWADFEARTREGWSTILAGLDHALTGGTT